MFVWIEHLPAAHRVSRAQALVWEECGNSGSVSIEVQRESSSCFPQGARMNQGVFLKSYRDHREEGISENSHFNADDIALSVPKHGW